MLVGIQLVKNISYNTSLLLSKLILFERSYILADIRFFINIFK